MTKLGFNESQNKVLLAVGQYVYAFGFLDMTITFALVDRLAGYREAILIVLRGMDFRVRHERLFKVAKEMDRPRPTQAMLDDFYKRLGDEYEFRNRIAHSQIGIELDGTTFLNSFGKGFGQASHIEQKTPIVEIQTNTQRCWRLFLDFSAAFSPARHSAFVATLNDM